MLGHVGSPWLALQNSLKSKPIRLRVTIFIASKTAIAPPGSQPYLTGSLSVASSPGQRWDGFQPIPKAILVMTRAGTVLGTYPQFAGGCIPK